MNARRGLDEQFPGYAAGVPVNRETKLAEPWNDELSLEAFAFSPGYDWENMYVIEPAGLGEVTAAVEAAGGRFSVIGRVEAGEGVELDGVPVDEARLPVDEKFAREYEWENRFSAW